MAASAQQAASMGSGLAAERSEGLQWSKGRPVAVSAQQVAPMVSVLTNFVKSYHLL